MVMLSWSMAPGIHLPLIHDLAPLHHAFLDHRFPAVAFVLEDQIGAVRLRLHVDQTSALQEFHILDRDIFAADALILLVLVLDVDLGASRPAPRGSRRPSVPTMSIGPAATVRGWQVTMISFFV